MSDNELLSVRGLRVQYPGTSGTAGTRAVHDVSFGIPHGETLALVGESGCGKTSVARAVLRLVEPEAGEIAFDGVDIRALRGASLRRQRQRMQIVFQDPFVSLNPRMTIADIIAEGLVVHDLAAWPSARARAADLLDEVGVPRTDAARYPGELSGGQRQRVAIARALAVDPALLVLDEAVSALDVTTQGRILDLFDRVRADRGLTSLFIAHNLAVVQRVASSVAIMYLGRIVEIAPAARLFATPRHPYTRALLSAVPIPDPRMRRPRALLVGDPSGSPGAGCPFYPRCPHPAKDAECTRGIPPLAPVGPGHLAACIKEAALPAGVAILSPVT